MAEIAKVSKPSLATPQPGYEHKLSGKYAGEALVAGDACYLHTDNKVYKATAAAANNAAQVWGWVLIDTPINEPCTLYWNVNIGNYNGSLSIGTLVYLSAAVAGGLQTVAQTNQTKPIGCVVGADRISVVRTF